MYKLLLISATVGIALGNYRSQRLRYVTDDSFEEPNYNYNWIVKDDYSGIDMGQQEHRDGYNTQGAYQVLLSDGRLQTVNYRVQGDSGFVADVSYQGEARYDNPPPAPSPIYVSRGYY